MPEVFNWSEPHFIAFILLLIRMSAFFVVWPVFYVSSVPVQVKVLLSVAVSVILFPVIDKSGYVAQASDTLIIWYVAKEVFVGVTIGYLARLFFYIFNIAGDLISISMGLSGVQILNPNFGGRSSAIEQFLIIIATLFFIAIDGHHLLIMGIADSFRLVPVFQNSVGIGGFEMSTLLFKEVTEMGVKMCAPALVSILFMNLALAIIGKAVPQFNVLITSLPVNILFGFLVLFISMPILLWQMDAFLELSVSRLFQFVRSY